MRMKPFLVVTALVLAACGGSAVALDQETSESSPTASSDATPARPSNELLEPQEIPDQLAAVAEAWSTDFSRATVDLNEILIGIPARDPRDLIRPIDDPVFEPVGDTDWLSDPDPGLSVEIDGDARFYPLSVLTRHEIVNDEFGDIPVAVTYCPLCNTGIVFDRRFEGEILRLGVSGLLRNSDLIMWDNKTDSLWQQITGEGIVGVHAGDRLTPIGSAIVRWADFATTYPDGLAMADNQGFGTTYGTNPYEFYSSRPTPYGFFQGEIDARYPALERVVGVSVDDSEKAYPFSVIQPIQVVNDTVNGQSLVVFWGAPDTADALDGSNISASKGIGTAVAYSAVVGDTVLTFEPIGDSEFRDLETGSTWTILGKAIKGELAGEELTLLPHRNEFWFAYQAFFPDAAVFEG